MAPDGSALASVDFEELTRPKAVGRPVNTHVMTASRELYPDFDRMCRMLSVPALPAASADGTVPPPDEH